MLLLPLAGAVAILALLVILRRERRQRVAGSSVGSTALRRDRVGVHHLPRGAGDRRQCRWGADCAQGLTIATARPATKAAPLHKLSFSISDFVPSGSSGRCLTPSAHHGRSVPKNKNTGRMRTLPTRKPISTSAASAPAIGATKRTTDHQTRFPRKNVRESIVGMLSAASFAVTSASGSLLAQVGSRGQAAGDTRPEWPERQEHREVGSRGHADFGRRREIGDGQPSIAEAAKSHIDPEVNGRMREAELGHSGSVRQCSSSAQEPACWRQAAEWRIPTRRPRVADRAGRTPATGSRSRKPIQAFPFTNPGGTRTCRRPSARHASLTYQPGW